MTGEAHGIQRWKADLVLALVALVWGTTFVLVKQALADVSTMYFLTLRFALASLCLLAIFARPFSREKRPVVIRGLAGGAAAGVFLWLGYVLQTFGLKYTSAGNSGFLTGAYIVFVPLLSALFYRRLPQRREILGIAVATAGILTLALPSLHSSLRMNKGDVLTIGCAVAFAIHLLLLAYYSQREFFQAVALGQIACTALLSAIFLSVEPPRIAWSPSVVCAVLITAVFATALAFTLQTWGQKYTTPTRTALIFALEPVFALATAVLVGQEGLSAASLSGGALILAGILAVELKGGTSADSREKAAPIEIASPAKNR